MTTESELKTTRKVTGYEIDKSFIINDSLNVHIFENENDRIVALDHASFKDLILIREVTFNKIVNVLKKQKLVK